MIPRQTENKWKRALFFTLSLLPVALVGGFFTLRYQLDMMPPEKIEAALAQVGSMWLVYAITILQTALYAAACGFFGYILADGLGLINPFRLSAKPLVVTLLIALAGGIALSLLDIYVFAPAVGGDLILSSVKAGLTLDAWMASLLYGGVIEEVPAPSVLPVARGLVASQAVLQRGHHRVAPSVALCGG